MAGRPKRPFLFKITGMGCFEITSHRHPYKGYPQMSDNGKTQGVHRFIWEECFGLIPDRMCVLHSCDNRLCVNPEHLFLGTNEDNMRDKLSKNRQARGEDCGQAKLTTRTVQEIRRRYRFRGGDDSSVSLAREFGVSRTAIMYVVRGETWKHEVPQ